VVSFVLIAGWAGAQPGSAGAIASADEDALRRLMPQADRFELVETGARHFRGYGAVAGHEPALVGLAFFTTDLAPRVYAYKGRITMLVAMDTAGRLIGVRVVHHYEPFGYFSIDLPAFADQFRAKSILDPLEVGDDIDGVSRATITVTAATRAIRQAARQLAREFLAAQVSER
jgi:transcriptional regulator of nitric oxide reductase